MKMDQTTIFIVILTLFVAACFFVNMVNVPIEGMTKAPNAPNAPNAPAASTTRRSQGLISGGFSASIGAWIQKPPCR